MTNFSRSLKECAIEAVYIRKPFDGPHYTCQLTIAGWKCGHCGRGNLGWAPKKAQQCRVCKYKVSQVMTPADFYFSSKDHLLP